VPKGHLRPEPGAFAGWVRVGKIAVAGPVCSGCVQLCVPWVQCWLCVACASECVRGVHAGAGRGHVLGCGCVQLVLIFVRMWVVCWVPESGRGRFGSSRCKQGTLEVSVKSVYQYGQSTSRYSSAGRRGGAHHIPTGVKPKKRLLHCIVWH
jgi:hypothetical protein